MAGGDGVGPVAGADVVAGGGVVLAGGGEKAVIKANVCAFRVPAEDEGLIVGVCEAAAATDWAFGVGAERVVGNGESGDAGIDGSAEGRDRFFGDLDDAVHVHKDGVLPGGGDLTGEVLQFAAGVEEELVGVGEACFGSDA